MVMLMKRGRGRPPKSDSQHRPEFFKIYLPEHNSQQLVIPPAFVENFKGKIPKKVVLKNSQGKVWNIELEEAGCKLLMKKGWEGYVSDNSLLRGEFLIFTYNGNSLFTVKIFSINGCEKNEMTTTTHHPDVKVKQESNLDQIFSHHTGTCEHRYPKRGVTVKEESQDSGEAMPSGSLERTFKSSSIRFTKVYDRRRPRRYDLPIPVAIFTEHSIRPPKINLPKMIVLRNQSGVSQSVKISQRCDRRVLLTCGWREFFSKNKIVPGDECEFEIILGKCRSIKEIVLLRVFRRKR